MLYIEFKDYDKHTIDTQAEFAIMYDTDGKVCAIEIENASDIVANPRQVDFEIFTEMTE